MTAIIVVTLLLVVSIILRIYQENYLFEQVRHEKNIAGVGRVEPLRDVPRCPDHNLTAWHGIWNYEYGCHYDQAHNHDLSTTIFAGEVQNWEQHVSYPWQTPHESEQRHKEMGS